MDVNNMQTEAATKLYVAPAGDDAAPGTIDEPLATMFGARNRLRKLIRRSHAPPRDQLAFLPRAHATHGGLR